MDHQSYKKCHQVCQAFNHVLSAKSYHEEAKKLIEENNPKLWCALKKWNMNELRSILDNEMVEEARQADIEEYHTHEVYTKTDIA